MLKLATKSRRLGRPLIAVLVAYAVAVQSLLIVLGGFSQLARADAVGPAFELCQHEGTGAPASPARAPDHSGCYHCIFCFAGAHHALIGSSPLLSQRADVAVVDVVRMVDAHGLPGPSAHSIAEPRGPPRRA